MESCVLTQNDPYIRENNPSRSGIILVRLETYLVSRQDLSQTIKICLGLICKHSQTCPSLFKILNHLQEICREPPGNDPRIWSRPCRIYQIQGSWCSLKTGSWHCEPGYS